LPGIPRERFRRGDKLGFRDSVHLGECNLQFGLNVTKKGRHRTAGFLSRNGVEQTMNEFLRVQFLLYGAFMVANTRAGLFMCFPVVRLLI
jgi:hypothetical protein